MVSSVNEYLKSCHPYFSAFNLVADLSTRQLGPKLSRLAKKVEESVSKNDKEFVVAFRKESTSSLLNLPVEVLALSMTFLPSESLRSVCGLHRNFVLPVRQCFHLFVQRAYASAGTRAKEMGLPRGVVSYFSTIESAKINFLPVEDIISANFHPSEMALNSLPPLQELSEEQKAELQSAFDAAINNKDYVLAEFLAKMGQLQNENITKLFEHYVSEESPEMFHKACRFISSLSPTEIKELHIYIKFILVLIENNHFLKAESIIPLFDAAPFDPAFPFYAMDGKAVAYYSIAQFLTRKGLFKEAERIIPLISVLSDTGDIKTTAGSSSFYCRNKAYSSLIKALMDKKQFLDLERVIIRWMKDPDLLAEPLSSSGLNHTDRFDSSLSFFLENELFSEAERMIRAIYIEESSKKLKAYFWLFYALIEKKCFLEAELIIPLFPDDGENSGLFKKRHLFYSLFSALEKAELYEEAERIAPFAGFNGWHSPTSTRHIIYSMITATIKVLIFAFLWAFFTLRKRK